MAKSDSGQTAATLPARNGGFYTLPLPIRRWDVPLHRDSRDQEQPGITGDQRGTYSLYKLLSIGHGKIVASVTNV